MLRLFWIVRLKVECGMCCKGNALSMVWLMSKIVPTFFSCVFFFFPLSLSHCLLSFFLWVVSTCALICLVLLMDGFHPWF